MPAKHPGCRRAGWCQQCSLAEADRNRSHLFRQGPGHQLLDRLGDGGGGQGGRPGESVEHHVCARHHGTPWIITDTTGCQVPGISKPTRLNCALYGIQLILKQLDPQIDKVGLMVFPGMSSTWTPCGSPSIADYGKAGIVYQVIHNALDTNYATSIGHLNDSSDLVKTVGDNSNGVTGCLKAPGGKGTFYAQAISAAQTALQSEGSSTAQNVIILLSDGEANAANSGPAIRRATWTPPTRLQLVRRPPFAARASCTAMQPGGRKCSERDDKWNLGLFDRLWCGQHENCPSYGSGSATKYDSPTGTNSNVWTSCTAMQKIASDQTKFYSTNASCSSVNNYTDVANAFEQTGVSLSKPRLVLY